MKIDKVIKFLGNETLELDGMSSDVLRHRIVDAEEAMRKVQLELEENEKYKEIVELKKAAELGKKEVNKRQKAIIAYALDVLSTRGE